MEKALPFMLSVLISVSLCAGCASTVSGGPTADSNGAIAAEQPQQAAASPEELALTAYAAFLAGDPALLESGQSDTWWIPDFQDGTMAYAYTYLDLDGDGVAELLIQLADGPSGYNGVFHFENGAITCWNSDGAELSCWDAPLKDGSMVRQYDFNGTRTYTIFRYTADGKTADTRTLFAREELIPEDSSEPCPYYAIDGEAVDETVFEEHLDALVTGQMLEPSAWTAL